MDETAALRGVRLQHQLGVVIIVHFAFSRLHGSDVTHILVGEIVHEEVLQTFHARFLLVVNMRDFFFLAVFIGLDVRKLGGVHLLLVVGDGGVVRVIFKLL